LINVFSPKITIHDFLSVNKALLKSEISGTSPIIENFESKFAKYNSKTYGVAVSNGSVALDLAFQALNLSENDVVTGSSNLSLSGLSTISSVDTTNNIITIQDTIIGSGISTETQLTITSGYDTNTDRGISYDYNTGIGTANNKTGFFGYDDSTGRWTYIPDATITNSVVSGTKGELDLGAAYFDWAVSGIHTRGSAYFDTNGKLISTLSPEVGYATTSNFVLTTDASNVPVWTSVLDGGSY